MKSLCEPDLYCTIKECYSIIEKYNFSDKWLKNKIKNRELSSSTTVTLKDGKKTVIICKKELENEIMSSIAITNIKLLFALIWNEKLERLLHYYAMEVRKNWKYYFKSKEPLYIKCFHSYEEFFYLKPKITFFNENKNIANSLPISYKSIYLDMISKKSIKDSKCLRTPYTQNGTKISYRNALKIVKKNGLDRRWLNKMIIHKGILCEGIEMINDKRNYKNCLISYKDLTNAISEFSTINSIEMLIKHVWSVKFAQALSSNRIDTKKDWSQNFNHTRETSSYSFYIADDFLVLRPKYNFFVENEDFLLSAMPQYYKNIFKNILTKIMSDAKIFIENNIETIFNKNRNVSYEKLLSLICDNSVFGISPQKTCKHLLHKTNKKKESIPEKEVILDANIIEKLETEDICHITSTHTSRNPEDIASERDFTKLITNFLQSKNTNPLDREILKLHIEGQSNAEILKKMGFPKNYPLTPQKDAVLETLRRALEECGIFR